MLTNPAKLPKLQAPATSVPKPLMARLPESESEHKPALNQHSERILLPVAVGQSLAKDRCQSCEDFCYNWLNVNPVYVPSLDFQTEVCFLLRAFSRPSWLLGLPSREPPKRS